MTPMFKVVEDGLGLTSIFEHKGKGVRILRFCFRSESNRLVGINHHGEAELDIEFISNVDSSLRSVLRFAMNDLPQASYLRWSLYSEPMRNLVTLIWAERTSFKEVPFQR